MSVQTLDNPRDLRHAARFSTQKAVALVQVVRHDDTANEPVADALRELQRALRAFRGRRHLSTDDKIKYIDFASADLTDALARLTVANVEADEAATLIGYAGEAIQRALNLTAEARTMVAAGVGSPVAEDTEDEDPDYDEDPDED